MAILSINPATGETLKTFQPLSDAQLEVKLQLAADAFSSFKTLAFRQRAQMMNKAAEILKKKRNPSHG